MNKDNKTADAAWDDVLGDDQDAGDFTPEMARKILAMNPGLRDKGMTTATIAAQLRSKPAPQPAPSADRKDVFLFVAELKDEVCKTQHELQRELARVQAELASLNERAEQRLCAWLEREDPNVASPVTQLVLEKEREFLASVGFSARRYAERRMAALKKKS